MTFQSFKHAENESWPYVKRIMSTNTPHWLQASIGLNHSTRMSIEPTPPEMFSLSRVANMSYPLAVRRRTMKYASVHDGYVLNFSC
jgi:hypothetical protein